MHQAKPPNLFQNSSDPSIFVACQTMHNKRGLVAMAKPPPVPTLRQNLISNPSHYPLACVSTSPHVSSCPTLQDLASTGLHNSVIVIQQTHITQICQMSHRLPFYSCAGMRRHILHLAMKFPCCIVSNAHPAKAKATSCHRALRMASGIPSPALTCASKPDQGHTLCGHGQQRTENQPRVKCTL